MSPFFALVTTTVEEETTSFFATVSGPATRTAKRSRTSYHVHTG